MKTLVLCIVIHLATAHEITVQTNSSTIVGSVKSSYNGDTYFSYTGIPYAKPPIGPLRFQNPQYPDSQKIIIATKEPPLCIQRNYFFHNNPEIEGKEDCLYLNVFTPKVCQESLNDTADCHVMIYIHWGGYFAGGSTTNYLGPDYFMDRKVVLVTFNYRLGPFGFLSTLDDESPGNFGLKDQVMALKWVRRNIRHFGGHRKKITIFGSSVGGGCVHQHLLSESSRGLFHRAISQSGNGLAPWALPVNSIQKKISVYQAQFVGCGNFSNSKEMIECLKSVPAEEIMNSQDYFKQFHNNPLIIYGPVIENKTDRNQNPFLTKSPWDYLLNGEIQKVPWITGLVRDEGLLGILSLVIPEETRKHLIRDFENLLSNIILVFPISTTDTHALFKNISEYYFKTEEQINLEDPQSLQGLVNVFSDRGFLYPLSQALKIHIMKGHNSIYLYSFEYKGSHTYGNLFAHTEGKIDKSWGICHLDDLLYLFKSPGLVNVTFTSNDKLLRENLLNIWTDFSSGHNGFIKVQNQIWKPVKSVNEINFLNITGSSNFGLNFQINKGFFEDRTNFWSNLSIYENNYMK
ncbi:hypothetical protein ABEB36_003045 [Hypothenemus hampei]|uniref:Carboxylesterase type B domain-containing protein n=1 Tax=Hypothenemus hampei TaxID=57062 RepID=A0ABD1F8I1_HYPHA